MKVKREIRPLAERCRPQSLDEFIGQRHLLGQGKVLSKLVEMKSPFSMILWGDPGCGKTTLARLIAFQCDLDSFFLSAISSGVTDVRKIIEKGKQNREMGIQTLLFLDEIHRFNKAQQDAVLGAVESGDIILIGATTENPSFQIIAPLLSRVRVLKLQRLNDNEMLLILDNAISKDKILDLKNIRFENGVKEKLIAISQGDARRMMNVLDESLLISKDDRLSDEILDEAIRDSAVYYDKLGDRHYDTISAFIKSIRGSDPNAAIYYLARMLSAGEDPEFIARRMIVLASEDIGNASPNALTIATATMVAVKNIGMPEAEIILAQCTTFLSSAPKSNASYIAIKKAKKYTEDLSFEIPMHLRNAPTRLMKEMGYSKGYKYPHNFEGNFVKEDYLPSEIDDKVFYEPSDHGIEKSIKDRLKKLWPERYG